MGVTNAEVIELRREGELRRAELAMSAGTHVLESWAMLIAYMVAKARARMQDEADMLRDIELVLRAVEVDQEELREARDILRGLGYSSELMKLLTALARKARSRSADNSVGWDRTRGCSTSRTAPATREHPPARQGEAAMALRLLRPTPKARR